MTLVADPHNGPDAVAHIGGRRHPPADHPALRHVVHLAAFVKGPAGSPLGDYVVPDSDDWSPKAMPALRRMYCNNRFGDCTIAGWYHLEGVWTANQSADGSTCLQVPDEQILADYQANCPGFDPATGAGDNGCDEVQILSYFIGKGKAACFARVDASNEILVDASIHLLENGYLALDLPDSYITPTIPPPGAIWDVDTRGPNPGNGHCVVVVGRGPIPNDPQHRRGVLIATWGRLVWMTYAALAAYCVARADGAFYVILTREILNKAQQKCPAGVDWAGVNQAFDTMYAQMTQDQGTPQPPPAAT